MYHNFHDINYRIALKAQKNMKNWKSTRVFTFQLPLSASANVINNAILPMKMRIPDIKRLRNYIRNYKCTVFMLFYKGVYIWCQVQVYTCHNDMIWAFDNAYPADITYFIYLLKMRDFTRYFRFFTQICVISLISVVQRKKITTIWCATAYLCILLLLKS